SNDSKVVGSSPGWCYCSPHRERLPFRSRKNFLSSSPLDAIAACASAKKDSRKRFRHRKIDEGHMTESNKQSEQAAPSDDVATLYSWANLHGAKYRDFSAARAQTRERARLRAEQPAEEEAAEEMAAAAEIDPA